MPKHPVCPLVHKQCSPSLSHPVLHSKHFHHNTFCCRQNPVPLRYTSIIIHLHDLPCHTCIASAQNTEDLHRSMDSLISALHCLCRVRLNSTSGSVLHRVPQSYTTEHSSKFLPELDASKEVCAAGCICSYLPNLFAAKKLDG